MRSHQAASRRGQVGSHQRGWNQTGAAEVETDGTLPLSLCLALQKIILVLAYDVKHGKLIRICMAFASYSA